MKKKIIIAFIVSIAIAIIVFAFIKNEAKVEMYLSSEFPESYEPYIEELKKKYPNWEFKALYTNLDWEYVIDNENVFGKNLVPITYSDSWKNTNDGEYNVEVDSGWVDASRAAVEYAMDPRNFLNYVRVFQFEELSYNSSTNTISSIEKILYGTEFYNKKVEYVTSSGENIVTDQKYSDLILSAAQTSKVSAFHLASRIKQEVGPFLSHSSISGIVEGYEGLYNFYNIGATSSSEEMGAIINGLQYAKDGKGASEETKSKYLIPWDTKEKAITGGAIFIGSSYINSGQNTIYLQKFHVYDTDDGELFWHQYMTNVLAPYSESKSIYNGYSDSDLLSSEISFIIPIYENMPELPALSPSISEDDFEEDDTEVFANVQTTLNVRTGPGTSYEILTSVQSGEEMTRIAKGKQSGELWDRVVLQNGMVGFVFQEYLEEVPEDIERPLTDIILELDTYSIEKGESLQLEPILVPDNADDTTIEYISENEDIATVNTAGLVIAKEIGSTRITLKGANNVETTITINVVEKLDQDEIIFDESLEVNNTIISGLKNKNNTVSELLNKIDTNYSIQIVNYNDEELGSTDIVGTGSKIKILDGDNTIREYEIVLYGDVNGDGKINSVDLLVLQRHILDIQQLDGIFVKAGNVRKNGKNPSSVDCLLIQRHILEIEEIEQ